MKFVAESDAAPSGFTYWPTHETDAVAPWQSLEERTDRWYRESLMHQTRIIRWSMGICLTMSVSLCGTLSYAGTIRDGGSVIGPAMPNRMISSAPTQTKAAVRPRPSTAVPEENEFVLRNIPTLSKPISVGGRTLVPYIGAGFGGGYATEFDRALNPAASASSTTSDSSNAGPRSLLGHNLIPNEVQLGIRFPF
ncbi:MAG: hypothetical protein P0120_02830 [Nitrospira sp.]|nr:hypothetical protein [Nitrospira sp.]